MLRKRIVGCLTIKNGIVVQSISFKKYLPVGQLDIAVEFLSRWGIDEIMILDIDASREKRGPDIDLIRYSIGRNFAPLGVGGGITAIEEMRALNHLGVEKVIINTAAVQNPEIVKKAAEVFGNQFVVVSIDVKKNSKGDYEIFTCGGTEATGLDPLEFARKAAGLGAGEILLTSIDRDGSKQGYDLELIRRIAGKIPVPLIACGGVGYPEHFYQGFEAGAQAAAAGNFFHFTEHSPITAKAYLKTRGLDIRIDTYATYAEAGFLENGRLTKRDERYLDKLRFQILPDEVI